MALKKVKKQESIQKSDMNKEEEIKAMNEMNNPNVNTNDEIVTKENAMKQGDTIEKSVPIFSNGKKSENEVIENIETTLKNMMQEHKSNNNDDSFFDSEELSGTSTPMKLEIEIQPQLPIDEGRYRFYVKNVSIEEQVMTKYGMKNKLVIEFHISRVRDEKDFTYDLKQKYNISNSSKSGFYQVYRDLTGEPPNGKINLRNLLGIKGLCEVKHVLLDNGDVFPKIVNISAEIHKDS